MRFLFLTLPLMACNTQDPNHLGNPLTWPVQAVSAGLENAMYTTRRKAVSTFVRAQYAALQADIATGAGATLTHAMDLARVTPDKRAALAVELQQDIYQTTDPDPIIVALMVYGD